ncbi:respiratory chain complex I subunit 1 family protein [Helicovermis profundi]|uniref:Respiratory chain complex I subunit 1 family protein n=2 Tax=Helicovermis profundi TaxID=3065157 RepID=A0AAU9ESK7_9FIRM|nr:respiratory chain complex I subunit 1 family protein [Clostridia bacterium S502]
MNIMNFIYAFLLLLFAFFFQTSITGINRKVMARLQRRRGPRWFQQYIDIFKAMSKGSTSHGWIFDFGVIMALGGIMATAILIPIGPLKAFPDVDNIFIITYLLAVGMLGMAMSASGSGNPWASIGVSRALTNMLAYDVPFMVLIVSFIFAFKTSSLSGFAALQQGAGVMGWNFFRFPLGGILALICLQGMLGKKPFDSFIAPAEIASGPMVEYGGRHLGMLFLLHEFSTFIEVSIIVHIFFGGGASPLEFMIKYALLYTFMNIIAGVFPRFKIDQAVKFYYKVPLALAFIQGLIIIFTGLGVS